MIGPGDNISPPPADSSDLTSSADRPKPPEPAAAASGVPDPAPATPAVGSEPTMRELMLKSIGGWWGLVDSALPAIAFVVANTVGGLTAAIWSGIAVGALIFMFRLVRKESPQQAISGFLGLAICIFIAKQTGEARGFFLLGIWRSALMTLIAVVSVALRRPAVGLIWEFVSPSTPAGGTSPGHWRDDKRLMRTYSLATLLWGAAYAVRFVLERYLYDQDATGWLGVVRIVVGYPMLIGLVAITFIWVRSARRGARRG